MKKRKASETIFSSFTTAASAPSTANGKSQKSGGCLPPFLSSPKQLKDLVQYVNKSLADPGINVSPFAPAFILPPKSIATFASFLSQTSQGAVDVFPRFGYLSKEGKAREKEKRNRDGGSGEDKSEGGASPTKSEEQREWREREALEAKEIHSPTGASSIVLRADIADKGAQISAGIPVVGAPSGRVGHCSGKSTEVQRVTYAVSWFVAWDEWSERKYSGNLHAVIDAARYLTILKFFRPFEHLCCIFVLDVERCKVAILFVPQNWRDAPPPDVATLGLLHPEESQETYASDAATGSLIFGDIAPVDDEEEKEEQEGDEEETESDEVDPKEVNDSYFPFKFTVKAEDLFKKLIPQNTATVSVIRESPRNGKNYKWSFRLKLKPDVNAIDVELQRSVPIQEALIFDQDLLKEPTKARGGGGGDGTTILRPWHTASLLFSRPVVEVLLKFLSECEKLQLPSTVQVHFDPDMFMLVSVRTKYFYFLIFLGSMEPL